MGGVGVGGSREEAGIRWESRGGRGGGGGGDGYFDITQVPRRSTAARIRSVSNLPQQLEMRERWRGWG